MVVIASRPHPIGSAQHAETLAYLQAELSKLGLTPEVQRTTSVADTRGSLHVAATVQNVLARLKGTGNGQAILLVAHFDSAPTSPGASDDGAGISALLETVRAIKASEPLKNDVIFLFTDAEEVGLLGAKAFVDEHAWFKDVKIALNFEARGTSGPSLMFETSDHNGWLISEFRKAVPYPRTNSLMYDIYRLLPNNTDFSMLKENVAGLNFAYLDDSPHYHTALDTIANLDQRSLQHQGSYALSLTRQLGNQSLDIARTSNAVYFDLLGMTVIYYSYAWITPLTVFVLMLLGTVIFLGFRRKRLTWRGTGLALLYPLVSMVAAIVGVLVLWRAIVSVHNSYQLMTLGETYNSGYYRLGFVALTVALTSVALGLFQRRISESDLVCGTFIWWAILLVLSSVYLPGGSYLFAWPLLFAIAGTSLAIATEASGGTKLRRSLSHCVCMIPVLVLFVPLVEVLLIGLTISMAFVVMVPVVLVLVLLLTRPATTDIANRWALPAVAATLSLVFLVAGSVTARSNSSRPIPNSIFYGLNADTGQSVWASEDVKPDDWTRQFLTNDHQRSKRPDLFPLSAQSFLNAPAPHFELSPPDLKLLDEITDQGLRRVRVLLKSTRQASAISVYEESNAEITKATINGKALIPAAESAAVSRPRVWGLRYFGPPQEGIELVLEVKSSQPLKLRLVDQAYGLPALIQLRPDFMIPSLSPETDSTLVSKTFIL